MNAISNVSKSDNHICRIVDVFACSDGGVELVKFRTAMSKFEEQSNAGDKDATEILNLVIQFRRLTDIVVAL